MRRLTGSFIGFASAAARRRAASASMVAIAASLNSTESMTGRERVEAAIALGLGDRPPLSAWGHTFKEEWTPAELARVTVERARKFGWDFVKFQLRASCFAEAFGSVYRPSGHRLRAPVLEQVAVPDIQTVFSPLTVAGYLVGRSKSRVMRDLRKHGEVTQPALQRIADVLVDFSKRSVDAGAAGIFYAISGYASRDTMPEQVYRDFVLPLDQSVLERMPRGAWFNVAHLCGSNLHFGLARDLPAQAISWSVHNQGNPTLAEGRRLSGKAVMGGLGQRSTLLYGPPSEIESEVRRVVGETGGRGLLVAPGCSVPPRTREANLAAMAAAMAT